MEIESSSDLLVRRGVLGALIIGLSLFYIVQGREPGALLYLISGGLALVFLLSAFTEWRRTGWIGTLAYVILVSALMVGKNGLLGLLTGLFLAGLTALQRYQLVEDGGPSGEADGGLDRFHSTP